MRINPDAADRDTLARHAVDRLPIIEQRILGLLYGLPSLGGGGHSLNPTEAASALRMKEERLARRHTEAIGKLAAVLDVAEQPQRVAYQLFRMATIEAMIRNGFAEFFQTIKGEVGDGD